MLWNHSQFTSRGVRRIVVDSIWPLYWLHSLRVHQRMSGSTWCTYTVQPMMCVKSRNGTTYIEKGSHSAVVQPPVRKPATTVPSTTAPTTLERTILSRMMAGRRFPSAL